METNNPAKAANTLEWAGPIADINELSVDTDFGAIAGGR